MTVRRFAVVMAGLVACASAAPGLAQEENVPVAVFAFEEIVTLGPAVAPGKTRNMIPITGGSFEGPGYDGEGIRGEILPGGWDWQLIREDGCVEIEADYFLRTDDGAVINIVNKGTLCPPQAGAAPVPARTHPVFEAPSGKYDWLNRSAFVGTLEMADPAHGPAVKIRLFRLK